MKLDEFAFVNQQLAGLLQTSVPLEGALRQLCTTMQRGELRDELDKLGADLAKGVPLKEAVASRKLPEFYVRMLQVGVQSNDLPGVLLQLADYYTRANALWTRLKGLMVYPLLVLIVAAGVSFMLAWLLGALSAEAWAEPMSLGSRPSSDFQHGTVLALRWLPTIVLGLAAIVVFCGVSVPALRRNLRWRLPPFREASLAQFASAMSLMLRGGTTLSDAIGLLRQQEQGSVIGDELARWQEKLSSGQGKLRDLTGSSKNFPPLFLWLVEQGGEDPARGFAKAAEMYQARALHHSEMMLGAALPVAIVSLGVLICCQVFPTLRAMGMAMDAMGS